MPQGEPAGAVGQRDLPADVAGRGAARADVAGRAWEKPEGKPRAALPGDRWTGDRAGVLPGRRAGWAADGPAGIRRARSWAPRIPGDQPSRVWPTAGAADRRAPRSNRQRRTLTSISSASITGMRDQWGCSARTSFRLSLGLRKLGGASLGRRRGAFGHAWDLGDGGHRRSAKLAANLFKRLMWPAFGLIHAGARRLPTVERHAASLSFDRYSEFTVPPVSRLVLGKLACQAGFVISFYDLSRPVTGPPFSVARTNT